MAVGKPTDPKVKAEIVNKIRNEGLSVSAASAQYNISSKTIYTWLRDGVVDGNRNLILENNKLRKELEIAYRILGRLTAETKRPKE
jgi:transposase-like protein